MSWVVSDVYFMLYDKERQCFCDTDGSGIVFWFDDPRFKPTGYISRKGAAQAFNRIQIKDLKGQIEIRKYKVTLEEVKE